MGQVLRHIATSVAILAGFLAAGSLSGPGAAQSLS